MPPAFCGQKTPTKPAYMVEPFPCLVRVERLSWAVSIGHHLQWRFADYRRVMMGRDTRYEAGPQECERIAMDNKGAKDCAVFEFS